MFLLYHNYLAVDRISEYSTDSVFSGCIDFIFDPGSIARYIYIYYIHIYVLKLHEPFLEIYSRPPQILTCYLLNTFSSELLNWLVFDNFDILWLAAHSYESASVQSCLRFEVWSNNSLGPNPLGHDIDIQKLGGYPTHKIQTLLGGLDSGWIGPTKTTP